jgi:hypothetical protein
MISVGKLLHYQVEMVEYRTKQLVLKHNRTVVLCTCWLKCIRCAILEVVYLVYIQVVRIDLSHERPDVRKKNELTFLTINWLKQINIDTQRFIYDNAECS